MPVVRDAMQYRQREQYEVDERVANTYIDPTEKEQQMSEEIIKKISEQFAQKLMKGSTDQYRDEISNAISRECAALKLDYESQKRLEKIVEMTALGNGPIEKYLQDPDVTEVVVQKYDNIVYEKGGRIHKADVRFYSEEHLETIIKRIMQRTGRQINLTNPIEDARLSDGSRVNATLPPVSPDGATLTIRKFNNRVLTGFDYVQTGSLSREMLYFLERCVKGRISIFVSGGTGTGKTTLLNMLSSFIPPSELIITIEDTCELQLHQPNVRRMEVRLSTTKEMVQIDQKALVRAALRQRPDRIILGETRDGSVVDLISAMSTGHEGSLSTIHANSPQNMCNVRIPILYSMNPDADFSERSIALQISEAVQVIVQISRFPDGSRKISTISCVNGVDENGKVKVDDIFFYDRMDGRFKSTGYIPEEIIDKIRSRDLQFNNGIFGR